MINNLKLCEGCGDSFHWDEEIIIVEEELYHKKCVILYPTGYVAFFGENCLGETENDDGSMVYDVLEEGEYEDYED